MLDKHTEKVSMYVKSVGVNLSKLSRDTGIPYVALYDSLANKKRDRRLRADEFFKICSFLHKNPIQFAAILLSGDSEGPFSGSYVVAWKYDSCRKIVIEY